MKNLFRWLSKFEPSPADLKKMELRDAELKLAHFQSEVEYTMAMRNMLMVRVKRLKEETEI